MSYYELPQIPLKGPVSCYHIKWRSKEILLFGDWHCSYINNIQYNLNSFLELIAYKTNQKRICVDFFHELAFQKNDRSLINFNLHNMLIEQLRANFGTANIYYGDEYPYFRIHGWELSQYTEFDPTNLFLGFLLGYFESDEIYHNLIYDFYCNNSSDSHDHAFKLALETKYNKYGHTFIYDNEKFLSKLIHKQIRNIDTSYFEHNKLFSFFKKKSINLRLAILETYSIARMFRKFEHKENRLNKCESNDVNNIIYFGGDDHVLNVFNFLNFLKESKDRESKDINILYRFDKRKTHGGQYLECIYQQSILLKLYDYFNLFTDNVEEIKQMGLIHDPLSALSFGPSSAPSFLNPKAPSFEPSSAPSFDPEAPSFKPSFGPPVAFNQKYYRKYLKYKSKYMKIKNQI